MSEQTFKKSIRHAFDEAAAGYDNTAMRFFDNSARYLVQSLPLKGEECILDVATGTGKIALEAAKHLEVGHVTGVDMSEGMLARAREKAAAADLKNISFQCADVDNAGLPEKSFDGMCCGFGVHFWSDMEASLLRLLPSLKSGSFVAISSFANGSFEPQSTLTLNRFKAYGVKLPDSYSWERLDSAPKIAQLFEKVGLKNLQTQQVPMGYMLKDALEWWDLIQYSGFRAFLNQLSPERAERFKAENLKEIGEAPSGLNLTVDVIFAMAYVR